MGEDGYPENTLFELTKAYIAIAQNSKTSPILQRYNSQKYMLLPMLLPSFALTVYSDL